MNCIKENHTLLLDNFYNITIQTSDCDKSIEDDIPRTFTEHWYFKKQDKRFGLWGICNAYYWHDPRLGYIQGFANIAALLMIQVG